MKKLLRISVAAGVSVLVMELTLRIVFHSWGAFFYEDECVDRYKAGLARITHAFALFHGLEPEEQSSVYEPDSNRGYRLRPGLRGARYYRAPISSNSLGARGTREFPGTDTTGLHRILALGDSYTFGENEKEPNTWPAQLASFLPETEILNFGASAYGHDQMLLTLKDVYPITKPDIVILGFLSMDISRNDTPRFCAEKPHFVHKDGRWVLENVPVPTPQEITDRYVRVPLLWTVTDALIEILKMRIAASTAQWERDERVTKFIFREFKKFCLSHEIRFLAVFIPGPPRQSDSSWLEEPLFDEICESLNLECLDASPSFKAAFQKLGYQEYMETFFIPDDMHYNQKGYHMVAQAIADYLSSNGM